MLNSLNLNLSISPPIQFSKSKTSLQNFPLLAEINSLSKLWATDTFFYSTNVSTILIPIFCLCGCCTALKHATEIISRQLSSKRFFFRSHKIFIFYVERKKNFVFYFLPAFFFLSPKWRPHRCWVPTNFKSKEQERRKLFFFLMDVIGIFHLLRSASNDYLNCLGEKSYTRIEEGKKYSVGKSVLSCICWESKMKIIIFTQSWFVNEIRLVINSYCIGMKGLTQCN